MMHAQALGLGMVRAFDKTWGRLLRVLSVLDGGQNLFYKFVERAALDPAGDHNEIILFVNVDDVRAGPR